MGDLLDQLLDELAERLAARVAERLRGAEPGMVAQTGSPLGSRRHCSAVRGRLARGEPGAAIVGRKHLLSPEALNEELARVSTRTAYRPREETAADKLRRAHCLPPEPGSVRAELERELAALKSGPSRPARSRPRK